eukprot:TRINITY_DN71113_c0_g1_i1.p1 TRINITY_DN71113_c0_g1~~TRINITY_DN71113_c0_g1_i1.p1  ORF type:complete len:461 (+),score=78.03 TRINITY_DN71113_c0_g1_i1:94-1476(+)
MPGGTIKDCLAAVGLAVSGLNGCVSLKEEWAVIKKAYFQKVLTVHPDKGGSDAAFRDVQAAFEVLRAIFDASSISSFSAAQDQSTAADYAGSKDDFKGDATPSWEFYAEAAKEVTPTYRAELARSGRSRCQVRGFRKQHCSAPFIEKGALRVGFMLKSGGYGLWIHLECWRVQSKVWLGLPDPVNCRDSKKFEAALLRMNEVTLCGVREMAKADRKKIVRHVMDKQNWTFGGAVEKVRKRPTQAGSGAGGGDEDEDAQTSTSLVVTEPKQKGQFVVPVPGQGAPAGSLSGKTFTLTGIFPEIGGGAGFKLGKDRARKMIESFGGKVTTSISGKTNVLVVGKDPGFSKVSKARKDPKVQLLSLQDLKVGLERGSLGDAKANMVIKDFARGYGAGGLAKRASAKELAVAQGTAKPALKGKTASAKAKARTRKVAVKRVPPLKRPAAARDSSAKARKVPRRSI